MVQLIVRRPIQRGAQLGTDSTIHYLYDHTGIISATLLQ